MTLDEMITNERKILEEKREQYEKFMEFSDYVKSSHLSKITECRESMKYHEQLVEWLEDYRLGLKMREINTAHLPKIQETIHKLELLKEYEKGYNKAIDEFSEKLCERFTDKSILVLLNGFTADILTLDDAVEITCDIARELKAGVENGNK